MRRRSAVLLVSFALAGFAVPPALAAGSAEPAATCAGLAATIVGTPGADNLVGTPGRDVIAGMGGDDVIAGLAGHDVICGNGGDDTIHGGSGADLLIGGNGRDELRGGSGRDALRGGKKADLLVGGGKRDAMNGGRGSDVLMGKAGPDVIIGGGGPGDTADGGAGTDLCDAEAVAGCETPDATFRLNPDGVGALTFGMPTDTVLVELALLGDPEDEGAPDDDTGWIDSFSIYGTCPGTEIRVVRWGDFYAFFTRDSIAEEGTFFTWWVSDFLGPHPNLHLQTEEGIRFGDTRAQLEVIAGSDVTIELADPFGFWFWYLDGNPSGVSGVLSDDAPWDRITQMQGGIGCGE